MKWKILLALVAALAMMASGAYADTVTGSSGSGFQTYPTTLTYNNIPYWDGASSDGTYANIGNFLTETGYFSPSNNGLSPNLTNPQWFGFGNANDTAAQNMYFTPSTPSNGSQAEMLIEVTAFATTNTFGWYLTSSPTTTRQQLFAGSNVASNFSNTFTPTGNYGFYLGVGSGTQTYYYMDSSANSADYLLQHFAIFRASDGSNPGDFFIGCEDLPILTGDKDFQDMVVEVGPAGGFSGVPLPPSALLLGSGLLGLVGWRRLRKS